MLTKGRPRRTRRLARTAVLLSFLLLPLAADRPEARAAEPPQSPGATALSQCELYPLAVDTTWYYKSGPLEIREKVVRHEEIQGELCARVETFYEDRVVGYEHLAVRADGVYRVAVGGKPVEPPIRIVNLPAKPGVKWTVNSTIAGKAVRGEFVSSEGSFHVRSQRGDQDQTFKTHRVTGENFEAGGESVSFTYDFLPQLGKVKQTARTHGLETTIELRDMQVPKKTPTRTAAATSILIR